MNIDACCEIGDLINEITKRTGKTYDEVETAAFDEHLYPTDSKTYVSVLFSRDNGWFRKEVRAFLNEHKLPGLYITLPS